MKVDITKTLAYKHIALLFLLLFFSITLAACGNTSGGDDGNNADNTITRYVVNGEVNVSALPGINPSISLIFTNASTSGGEFNFYDAFNYVYYSKQ